MLSLQDINQISKRKISPETFIRQIEQIRTGFNHITLVAPATPSNGITVLSEKDKIKYVKLYNDLPSEKKIVKFVPASGAATRMFSSFYTYLNIKNNPEENKNEFLSETKNVEHIIENLSNLALYHELEEHFRKKNINLNKLIQTQQYKTIIEAILYSDGLGYGSLPKALLNFHNYGNYQRKCIDEHLVEGALYASNVNDDVNIHFTISPQYEILFKNHIQKILPIYKKKHKLTYNITLSFQYPSTDTPALDRTGNIFRDKEGNILFRPAGHGALITNLNEIDSDIIFIKNIDNVTTDSNRSVTIEYKKILVGILFEKVSIITDLITSLTDEMCSIQNIEKAVKFVSENILFSLPSDFQKVYFDKQRKILIDLLNRPIRVCGMIKKSGEVGGYPFFVKNKNGDIRLQIVEKPQIDFSDPEQIKIVDASTHFNPVDIIAKVTDFQGCKFNLTDFIDNDAYIITQKTHNGKPLMTLELPGLWNGAMAKWITFFVEVPAETYTPVKEINDLLKPEHIN